MVAAIVNAATAQNSFSAHDARSSGMGGCFSVDTVGNHVRLAYRQPFGLGTVADKHIDGALRLKGGGVAMASYTHHGSSDYYRQQALMGYGLRLASWLRGGTRIGFHRVATSSPYYEPQWNVVGEAYLLARVAGKVRFALLLGTHPEGGEPNRRGTLQVGYSLPQVEIVAEAEATDKVRVRVGAEYNYREVVFLRAGVATGPVVATCGVGLKYKYFSFDFGVESHNILGLSPHTSLTLWL